MKQFIQSDVQNGLLRDFTADTRLLVLSAMALVTGCLAAGSASALLKLIALFTNLAYLHRFSTVPYHLAHATLGPLSVLTPVAGGIIVGLMARYGSEKIRGHGIPEALDAILTNQSRIAPRVAFLKPLSSAIAIGTGGPFGAEGPIIMTGGALGSLFAQLFALSAAERKTLLAAGAAAGMTAIFGTPVAAVLLAIEVLLFERKPRSLVPVAISAITAAAWRPWLIGAWPLFAHSGIPPMPGWGLAACAVVGLIAGLQSAATSAALYATEDLFRKLPVHWMWWPALGGVVVGLVGWYDPAVLGVGYDNIRSLIDGSMTVPAIASLLVGKAVVWIVALSSGTSGGVLAPLLMMGGALGALEAHLLPFGDSGFWALVAMSAVFGGALRAPLAATVFAVELTGDLQAMPAVAIACVVSFATTVLLLRRSILTERLARRGLHMSYEYAVDPFEITRVREVMTAPVRSLPSSLPLRDALALFEAGSATGCFRCYPVVSKPGRVIGVASHTRVLQWIRQAADKTAPLADFCAVSERFIGYADECVGALADRMTDANVDGVPIVARDNGELVGFVSRCDLLRVRASVARLECERNRVLTSWGP